MGRSTLTRELAIRVEQREEHKQRSDGEEDVYAGFADVDTRVDFALVGRDRVGLWG